ncbi:MAG: hypothetical protein FWH01_01515, partial [Oscillospiraceae bacterium]|nr:hypothetical protein [Oscillospiraceae bacterium]
HTPLDSVQSGFGRAGQYRQLTHDTGEIELLLRSDFDTWAVAAILVHECAHHWLVINALHAAATNAPEIECRTDIATVYTGFGRVMKKGYAEKTVRAKTGVFSGILQNYMWSYRIGYLNQTDFELVSLLAGRCAMRGH